jgi:hypothetical protein
MFTLSGCVQEVRQGEEDPTIVGAYNNPLTWLRAAKLHEDQGDLQRALYEYRLAKTVSHSDYTIQKHLRRVERKIEERTAALLKKAEHADSRGRVSMARGLYLEILGLQPDHRQALAALRKQEKGRTLLGMKKKQALARQSRYKRQKPEKPQLQNAYSEEDYNESPQKVGHATSRPIDARKLIQKLERHEEIPPQNNKQHWQQVGASLVKAEKAYQSQQWDDALDFLSQAEQTADGDELQLQAIEKARKKYARELYNKGVISYRSEPQKALNYWRYALKFDSEDEKSRLRIRNMSQK